MDTNHNSNNDSLIPKQPVIGAGIPEKDPELTPGPNHPVASSNTIGAHNVSSLRLAAGRSFAGTPSSSSSSTSSSSATSTSSSDSGSSTNSFVSLRGRAARRAPVTPAKIHFLILGSSGTGKTSLLRRLQNLNVTTDTNSSSTIGPDLHRLKCGQVEAIDIGGSDVCHPIAQAYAELFDVFVVMFDITSAESFLYARYWMDYLEQRQTRDAGTASESAAAESAAAKPSRPVPTILLIGNKKDLEESMSRQVSKNLARNLAITFGAEYIEISAKHDLTLSETILETLEKTYEANIKSAAAAEC